MMKAEVSGNVLEISLSRGDALSLVLSGVFAALLFVFAGWQIAVVAVGMSLLGAYVVDMVQRSDIKLVGH